MLYQSTRQGDRQSINAAVSMKLEPLQPPQTPQYSFILPVYNEELTLPELFVRMKDLLDRLDGEAEVILVDDGSRDKSLSIMLDIHRQDRRFKIVQFSRNFGHQVAITAGMDVAVGDAVVIMDADLQDPPEVVLEMIARWREGYDIVYAERVERQGETWFKRKTAEWFYRLERRLTAVDIPANVGDFRLVDRSALDAFRQLRESNRYVRGMFSWIGYKQTSVKFVREKRYAGAPQYTFMKSCKLAMDAILSFSIVPLRLALMAGLVVSAFSVLSAVWAVVTKMTGYAITGWTSLAVLVSFFSGVQLLVLGVLGEYLGRIYDEAKGRPIYIVRSLYGLAAAQSELPTHAVILQSVVGEPSALDQNALTSNALTSNALTS